MKYEVWNDTEAVEEFDDLDKAKEYVAEHDDDENLYIEDNDGTTYEPVYGPNAGDPIVGWDVTDA